ncbi:hypothetical protein Bca101_056375 [Brassica carinata]
MHVFDGSLPFSWIARVERFFRIGRYVGDAQLELVSLSLEGHVLHLYNRAMEVEPFVNWRKFKKRMIDHFCGSMEKEPGKWLFSIKQTGSIQEYVSEFEELVGLVPNVSDQTLIDVFYNGLKPEMQEIIKIKEPWGLHQHKEAVLKMETSVLCQVLSGGNSAVTPTKHAYTPNMGKSSVKNDTRWKKPETQQHTFADAGKLSLTANQLQSSPHQLTTLTKQGFASRCSREPRNMTIFSCHHVNPPASHRHRKVETRRKMLSTESRAAAEEEKS